jgi:WD40 repeat protein
MKTAFIVALTVSILAGGLFLTPLCEEAELELSPGSEFSWTEAIYDIQIDEGKNAVLLRTRHNIVVRHRRTGELIRELSSHPLAATAAVWVPTSERILVGCSDGRVLLWESSGSPAELPFAHVHKTSILAAAVSKSGRIAVTASGDCVCLWNLEHGRLMAQSPMKNVTACELSFSPDDRRVLVGCWDGHLRILDAKDLRLVQEFQPTFDGIVGVGWIENGERIVVAHQREGMELVNTITGERNRIAFSFDAICLAIAISPDQRFLAGADYANSIHLYSLDTFDKIATLKGHSKVVTALQFSENGPWLYSGSHDGTLRIWDLQSFEEMDSYQGSLPGSNDEEYPAADYRTFPSDSRSKTCACPSIGAI